MGAGVEVEELLGTDAAGDGTDEVLGVFWPRWIGAKGEPWPETGLVLREGVDMVLLYHFVGERVFGGTVRPVHRSWRAMLPATPLVGNGD